MTTEELAIGAAVVIVCTLGVIGGIAEYAHQGRILATLEKLEAADHDLLDAASTEYRWAYPDGSFGPWCDYLEPHEGARMQYRKVGPPQECDN
ncbi:hypothetical protein [Corynebacterium heidelbergense]|uniref:hypothetical protein n=1 Tax=Corynebacterium heidelbergense TaxID=2055947 RepID=UPI0011BFA69B|nr:hypothetical protein [Corynebacterium heidelbergense]WCZ36988.1 hypothetical protein CHEID_07275 [Corynebacterium heidelbergense]